MKSFLTWAFLLLSTSTGLASIALWASSSIAKSYLFLSEGAPMTGEILSSIPQILLLNQTGPQITDLAQHIWLIQNYPKLFLASDIAGFGLILSGILFLLMIMTAGSRKSTN